ncbi:glycosyl hydrolase [Flavobacterium franklandianum]|uniref:glycoside hydrolase family 17 protein n=1 Tax=Flavobacterium franklandianum TaxID=2594430 RepID=UPI00117B25AE|nr:glycosyl hydrolase family 17 protein [Flavobacterium franklandianum]TRX25213.1 glycosyl hydrolase [Flavobacterium franklandianum]
MSYKEERYFSIEAYKKIIALQKNVAEIQIPEISPQDLSQLWGETLENGIHGISFSAYEEGQKPGDIITEEQVRRRMKIIAPYTKWVRSFSCTEGNEFIPVIAHEFGIKTLVGAWLGDNSQVNEAEIEGLIKLANEGYVDIAAVGNEVMFRKDMTEDELLEFINRVKKAIPSSIPVGYVDNYYEFSFRSRITDVCDVILANCYPYWDGCSIDYSLHHMQNMFETAKSYGGDKRIIITETGWPSEGGSHGGAHASKENALRYFIDTQKWSKEKEVEIFYFSSFDESWKVGTEGNVGAYWGIWDKNEKLKNNTII